MAGLEAGPAGSRRLGGALGDPIALAIVFCVAVSLVFLAFPAIDVWASGLFYDPAAGFPAATIPALRLLRASGDRAMEIVVAVLLGSLVLKIALPSRRSVVPPRASLFLIAALILGPGLLVNVILKDHWGRPRPASIVEFGGAFPYVEVWRISDYCARNCSFVAGEASSAIWLTALAFVVPRQYRWPVLVITGLFALALSLNRIAFGGHFASDVLLAWGLTALVMAILYRVLFLSPPAWLANERMEAALAGLGRRLRRPFAPAGGDGAAGSPSVETGASPMLVAAVVLGFLLARLVAGAFAHLAPDEAYYWLWSRHLSAGYYDHPPMVAWWIRLGTTLFGNSALGLRALSIVSAVPVSAALYLTGSLLFDRAIAARAVIFFNAALLMGVGGMIVTPDEPSLLFWSLATLAFALLVRTGRPVWWLVVGLCAGLGVVSKLTNLFLGLGVVLAVLADRDLRRWLATPWLWLGATAAIAVIAPMILWNAAHHWVTFTKQFGRISVGPLQPYYFGEFVVGQFLFLNPFVAIFTGLAAVAWFRRSTARRREVGLLFATALPLLVYMTRHALGARVEGNWPAPIYPTLALIAASAAESVVGAGGRIARRRLRSIALPFGAALTAIGLVVFALPDGTVPRKADFASALRGWPDLAEAVDRSRRESGAVWIATAQYSVNAEFAYYLRDRDVPVIQVTDRIRYVFAPSPDQSLLEKPALLVVAGTDLPAALRGCFARIEPIGEFSRGGVQSFSAFRVEGMKAGAFAGGC